MQFSALIEYLVTGIVSSVWISAIINEYIPIPIEMIKDYKEIFVVVYFPVAYILGIYIDVISSYFIRRVKELYSLILEFIFIKNIHDKLLKTFTSISGLHLLLF